MTILGYYNNVMENYVKVLLDALKKENIEPTETMLAQFELYYNYLIDYNQNVNLTAITEKADVYVKHFADCVLGSHIYKKDASLCDIGTGAGFPGVVLKIIRPDLNVTLVDSLNKRIAFLDNLIAKLNLRGIKALHHRAEDVEFKNNYLNLFDYVVARAVANLTTLTEYCLPYVKIGGSFVAYKSIDAGTELLEAKKCISVLGGGYKDTLSYNLQDATRNLIVINKIKPTNNTYPRGLNKPKLRPIK